MEFGIMIEKLTVAKVGTEVFDSSKLNQHVNACRYSVGSKLFFGLGFLLEFIGSFGQAYADAVAKDKEYADAGLAAKANVDEFNSSLDAVVKAKFNQVQNAPRLKDETSSVHKQAQQNLADQFETASENFAEVAYKRFITLDPDASKTKAEKAGKKAPATVAFQTFQDAINVLIQERYHALQKNVSINTKWPQIRSIQTSFANAVPFAAANEMVKESSGISTAKDRTAIEKRIQALFPKITSANVTALVNNAIKTNKPETAHAVKETIASAPKADEIGADEIKAHREKIEADRKELSDKFKSQKKDVKTAQEAADKILKALKEKDDKFKALNKKLTGKGKAGFTKAYFASNNKAALTGRYQNPLPTTAPVAGKLFDKHAKRNEMFKSLVAAEKKVTDATAERTKTQTKLNALPTEKMLKRDGIVKQHLIKTLADEKAAAKAFVASLA